MSEMTRQQKDQMRIPSIVELTAFNAPMATEGVSKYGTNKDWVAWGEENDYFDRLIDLEENSATNSRCIVGIADMIYGEGLSIVGEDPDSAAMKSLNKVFPKEDVRRVAYDLKMLGQGSWKVVYNKSKTKILKARHFPTDKLRAGYKTKLGEIESYYYHPNWSEISAANKPTRIPAFGMGGEDETEEILVVRRYASGHFYYSPVDYHACLVYAQLEKEVGILHVAKVQNGLNPLLLINFNDGKPSDPQQKVLLERKMNDKFAGAENSGRPMIQWNDDPSEATTIEAVNVPDIHEQYEFLANEGREKIMLGHGITSPILLGIKDNTGFGNNAEELRTASVLMDNILIKPFQNILLSGVDAVREFNGTDDGEVYIKTLQPIEFTELDNIETSVVQEKETGEKVSGEPVDKEE